jgi:opacity protein-like surface antigen
LNWKLGGFGLAPDIAGPIGAADLPSRKAPPADLAPAPAFPWTGFYVGANGGYGGGVVDADLNLGQPPVILGGALLSPGFLAALHTSNRTGGLIAGGQVGYNFQFANNVVLGLESDAQWSDIKQGQHEKAASTLILVPIASARTTDQQFGLDWFGTTRLRAGYALGRFLPYVTGGVAYGRVSASGFQNIMGSGPGLFGSSASATHVGWTAGAGAEYAFTDRLSLKGEYLFTEFNGVSGPILALAPPPIPAIGSFSTGTFGSHLVRAGVNWRFGAIAGSY